MIPSSAVHPRPVRLGWVFSRRHKPVKRIVVSIALVLALAATPVALLAQEEKYHSIFDRLAEGIFQTTPNGQYLLANAALARIYGYASPEELMASVTDIARRLYVAPGRREGFQRLQRRNPA